MHRHRLAPSASSHHWPATHRTSPCRATHLLRSVWRTDHTARHVPPSFPIFTAQDGRSPLVPSPSPGTPPPHHLERSLHRLASCPGSLQRRSSHCCSIAAWLVAASPPIGFAIASRSCLLRQCKRAHGRRLPEATLSTT